MTKRLSNHSGMIFSTCLVVFVRMHCLCKRSVWIRVLLVIASFYGTDQWHYPQELDDTYLTIRVGDLVQLHTAADESTAGWALGKNAMSGKFGWHPPHHTVRRAV